jgi:type II secretory pathway pseudopilin PulG
MVRGIVKLVMLGERGDTLIEVTFALAILGAVLLGCTSVAAAAYRLGQTARERTSVAEVAQEQMEALRSFRDNSLSGGAGSWDIFRNGLGASYYGVDNVPGTPCKFQQPPLPTLNCFHMELKPVGASTMWVPVPGDLTTSSPGSDLTVPTAWIEISASSATGPGGSSLADPGIDRKCGYDFELHYEFQPIGGGVAQSNKIQTRLANLEYNPSLGGSCP